MSSRFINHLYFKILTMAIFINLIIYSISAECPKKSPIIKDDNCTSIYCSESQFNSGECKINNSIAKAQWINNIIKFENTNGDFNLAKNKKEDKIVFSTTFSNKEERVIFGLDSKEKYIFRNGTNHFVSYISKNIGSSHDNEITNGECLLYEDNNEYLFLMSKENTDIPILNLTDYENDFDYILKSEFLAENKNIKGDYSYCMISQNTYLFFGAITSKEEDS